MHLSYHDGELLYSDGPQGERISFSTLEVFMRFSMTRYRGFTLLHFVWEQALFSMKEQFLCRLNTRLIKNRNSRLTEHKGKVS